MGVVTDPLVEIVAKVVTLGVPHAVLVVNKGHLRVVSQQAQNVVLLSVVVREDDFIAWDDTAENFLIAILEVSLLQLAQSL